MTKGIQRRSLLKKTAASAGGIASMLLAGQAPALASTLTHAHEKSLKALDKNEYTKNLKVHGLFNDPAVKFTAKVNMMVKGDRRFLFSSFGSVWEVTNPMTPKLINSKAFSGAQVQVAYNKKARKWILMTSHGAPYAQRTDENPWGKYGDPRLIPQIIGAPGLRGVRMYDCTDPYNIKLLSEWSCDQGDPKRPIQTGDGPHRCYYDGGKYAYLSASPDNSFIRNESPDCVYSWAVQIIDIEDPANPKFVSNFWFPGQRVGEEDAYKLWRESGDRMSFTSNHGPQYVPIRVEDGGKYCYVAYSTFGFVTLDVSNPKEPKLVSQFRPPYLPSNIPVHTIYPAWIDKGLMITTAEAFNADCYEPWVDNYVVDIKDITNPKAVSAFGNWTPPPEAPYTDFCDARGRKGTHNPPFLKAPGKPHPTWCGFAGFNAGLQTLDFSDPANPRSAGYYIPANQGDIAKPSSYIRLGESLFVEWDRNLIWFGTNNGVYLVSDPALGEPIFDAMPVKEWALPHLNVGAPT